MTACVVRSAHLKRALQHSSYRRPLFETAHAAWQSLPQWPGRQAETLTAWCAVWAAVLLKKLADLVAFSVHDAVDAKVQVGLVHLEHLSQLADELLALVVVCSAHAWRFQA